MQKFIAIGNIVNDLELVTTENGKKFCSFTLAIPQEFIQKDGEKHSDFLKCIVWSASAENLVKYAGKGAKICTVGRIQTRDYEDKEGNKKYITEVICESIEYLKTKKEDKSKNEKKGELKEIQDENLPF